MIAAADDVESTKTLDGASGSPQNEPHPAATESSEWSCGFQPRESE